VRKIETVKVTNPHIMDELRQKVGIDTTSGVILVGLW
jgi:hypothetical protein